jgi:hypothetical protein
MLVENVKSIFSAWNPETLSAAGINFKETSDPTLHPNDDYRVIYEASFEPNALDKARIEFWVTDTGHVAIGIETYERITKRTRLMAFRGGFALGHEPRSVSEKALQILFDAVSHGRVTISVYSFLRTITSIELFLKSSDYQMLTEAGYQPKWISLMGNKVNSSLIYSDTMLMYRPWAD